MTLDIESVLAGHEDWDHWGGENRCLCGAVLTVPDFALSEQIAAAHRAHVAAVLREQIAAAIEAEAERAHAAFASDEDDHLADMKNRLGVDLEPRHWNRHDDGCSMCGMAGAARIVRAAQVAPPRVPGEGS